MKKSILIILALVSINIMIAQEESAFQTGEWFRFKMSYSGFWKAGNATLTIKDSKIDGKPV